MNYSSHDDVIHIMYCPIKADHIKTKYCSVKAQWFKSHDDVLLQLNLEILIDPESLSQNFYAAG